MWFHYFITLVVIVFILYFGYETIRKMFFPTEEESFDPTKENLQRKIQELNDYKNTLDTIKEEVNVTKELKTLEKELKKYKKLLVEVENQE